MWCYLCVIPPLTKLLPKVFPLVFCSASFPNRRHLPPRQQPTEPPIRTRITGSVGLHPSRHWQQRQNLHLLFVPNQVQKWARCMLHVPTRLRMHCGVSLRRSRKGHGIRVWGAIVGNLLAPSVLPGISCFVQHAYSIFIRVPFLSSRRQATQRERHR